MKKTADIQHIPTLILKKRFHIISSKEENELKEWILEDNINAQLYESFQKKDFYNSFEKYHKIDTKIALKKYKERYSFKNRLSIKRWSLSVAASILILFLGYYDSTLSDDPVNINAGSAKALLILSSGEKIDLAKSPDFEKVVNGNQIIKNSEHTLNYQGEEKEINVNRFNELIIPLGGEYKIELSDGTTVWMNSLSKLRFPVAFDHTERKVYLEGEAYFEVAKDEQRPFNVVINEKVTITVLGTSFNVRAYKEEESVETVLEEGSVLIDGNGNRTLLYPNQRASYNHLTSNITVDVVNTRNFTSWKNGHFVFNEMSIEKIMNDLSRWYSFDVEYEDQTTKEIIFSGSLRKYDNLDKFLSAIELAGGVTFEITGNKIRVINK